MLRAYSSGAPGRGGRHRARPELLHRRADRRVGDHAAAHERDGSARRIIDTEREAVALLLRSLARLGDSAGVYGFSGSGRHDVRVRTVKDFREPLSIRTFERLAGLTPIHMTRLAPVIRHVARKLTAEAAETRLLLVVSDGRPFDLDYGDGYPGRAIEYANLDTQAAVEEALAQGIEPFVVTPSTCPSWAASAVTATVGTFGRLDALVNLAAVGDSGGALDDLTVDEIDTVLRTNLRGALLLAQECARPMRAGGGSIINVASIGGHRVTPGRLVYGPSKAALIYLTRQLAAELGPDGIRANSISPGQTPTALRKFSDPAGGDNVLSAGHRDRPTTTGRIPLGRRGTLDDYVGAILFLISGLSAYVTGTDLLVDGGAAILR